MVKPQLLTGKWWTASLSQVKRTVAWRMSNFGQNRSKTAQDTYLSITAAANGPPGTWRTRSKLISHKEKRK
jgi:hypothetical protein